MGAALCLVLAQSGRRRRRENVNEKEVVAQKESGSRLIYLMALKGY